MDLQPNISKFHGWKNHEILNWVDEFENFHPTTYQENNKHLYHEAIKLLFYRDYTSQNISLRHKYFTEINTNGGYTDYIAWRRSGLNET